MSNAKIKSMFIASWVSQQQRVFHQSTGGIMTPEAREELERYAEAMFAEHDRQVAERAFAQGVRAAQSSNYTMTPSSYLLNYDGIIVPNIEEDYRPEDITQTSSVEITDEMVEKAYRAWVLFPHKRGVNNAVDAIRAVLETALGDDNE